MGMIEHIGAVMNSDGILEGVVAAARTVSAVPVSLVQFSVHQADVTRFGWLQHPTMRRLLATASAGLYHSTSGQASRPCLSPPGMVKKLSFPQSSTP